MQRKFTDIVLGRREGGLHSQKPTRTGVSHSELTPIRYSIMLTFIELHFKYIVRFYSAVSLQVFNGRKTIVVSFVTGVRGLTNISFIYK